MSHQGDHRGASARALPAPAGSALLVIDCQRAFTDPSSRTAVCGSPDSLPLILDLVRGFRASGRPVAATRHAHEDVPGPGGMGSWWRSFVMDGTPASQLDPRLDRSDLDFVVVKHHYSAFHSTRLGEMLCGRGVSSLVICGFQTHICVESTARGAFDAGFDVILVPEACGSTVPALHRAAVACMSHALAHCFSVREALEWLAGK